MPSYDYKCDSCDFEFEAFHSMSMKSLINCPDCDQPKLVKLISPGAAIIIKGTKNPCRGGQRSKTHNDKLGEGKNKGKKPFWRDGKINMNVLNNPEKYIKQGEID